MATIAQSGALSILKFDDVTGALVMQSQIHQSNPAVEQDLHQWKDAAGNVLASIAYKPAQGMTAYLKLYDTVYTPGFPYGTYFKATHASINTFGTKVYFDGNTSGVPVSWAFRDNGINEGLTIMNSGRTLTTNSQYTGGLTVLSSNATYIPLTIKGAASQTGNLLEWQNSAGSVVAGVGAGGAAFFGRGTQFASTVLGVSTAAASNVGLLIQGAASQTADLQQWQDSTGSTWASINPYGVFNSNNAMGYQIAAATYYGSLNGGQTARIQAGNSVGSNPHVVVRQVASATGNLQEWQNSAGSILTAIDKSGNIGIGIAPTVHNLQISNNITGNAFSNAIFVNGTIQSDVTARAGIFYSYPSVANATFTTPIQHFTADQGNIGANATVSYQYGFVAGSSLVGASVNYGFFGNIPSGTNRWNLYMNGTAYNFLQGNTGIGSSPSANTIFNVSKNITGGTQSFVINSGGTIQSDVTSDAFMFSTYPGTQATAFTLSRLSHYVAGQGTFGAGSTVTNQYGFNAGQYIIGATNNYGFYGDLAAATGRWNFYANGTAANYFAGQTTIGSTSLVLGSSSAAHQFGIVPSAATTVGQVIRGAASQTANLQEWQLSNGSVSTYINSAGQFISNVAMAVLSGNYGGYVSYIESSNPSYKGLAVRGAASQTANLQEWQNSAGSVLGQIDSAGNLNFLNRIVYSGQVYIGTGNYLGASMHNVAGGAGEMRLLLRGTASQTADLQQWQNSSGTVLASMSASGAFSAVTKSFVIKHPIEEGKLLRYGSLEGPENGVYIRGKIDGGNVIDLPDYWTALVDESTITVNITPIGSSQNLYIEEIKNNKVYVAGGMDAKFFYTVFAERKDVAKLVVEE